MNDMKPGSCFLALAGCVVMAAALAPAIAQDRIVLGIELGSRFQMPACKAGETASLSRLCFTGALTRRAATGADEYFVSNPTTDSPHMRGDIHVMVFNNIVESVQVGTWGIEAQDNALTALTKKYGAPTRTWQERPKGLRARISTKFAEWDLRDFSVRLEGSAGSIDWGRIGVSTHRYRKRIEDYEKRTPAKSTKMQP